MLTAAARWGGGADERPYLPRAFSYARAREDGALEFLLEAVGPGTERLAELEPGEDLLLVGPLGRGFAVGRRLSAVGGEAATPLLVGGGIGAAPLLCLAEALGIERAQVLLGFRSAAHAEAARLFAPAQPALATDDGSVGRHGLVTELLREALEAVPADSRQPTADQTVYACGPPPMLEAVRALCGERGVKAQLAMESGMACGFGACFGCVVPTKSGYVRLCVDGPVLEAAELDTALVAGAGH